MRISAAVAGAVLTMSLIAISAFARDDNVLCFWTLVPAKSDFAGQPVVQTGTVTIHDRQGIIIVERSFVYEGAAETFFYSDVTDSEHNATIKTGKDLKSKTSWDHDVLTVRPRDLARLLSNHPCCGRHHEGQRRKAGSDVDHPGI